MADQLSVCWKRMASPWKMTTFDHHKATANYAVDDHRRHLQKLSCRFTAFASKSGGISLNLISKSCKICQGKGAIECPGCKGTGKNKKNGNIFERWKCFDCQGFGLKSCPVCGEAGLTPEQRGER
ncbi:hypothetical protein Dimus_006743 [Dionaea muscipula]